MLEALADTAGSHLVFAPGIPERTQRQFTSARVRISSEPFRMHSVMAQCDTILCHAGGMSNLALDHGKPVLLLPMQTEQLMTSVRIANLDAGVYLPLDGNPGKLRGMLERVLGDPAIAAAARDFAQTRPYGDQEEAVDTMVATCDRLLAGRSEIASGATVCESTD